MIDEKALGIYDKLNSIKKERFEDFCNKSLSVSLPTISEYLYNYIVSHNLSLAEIIKNSGLSKDYAYAIFNGNRTNPARDRIIALCLSMKMPLSDAAVALALCKTLLYPYDRRDAAIILCFSQKISTHLSGSKYVLS